METLKLDVSENIQSRPMVRKSPHKSTLRELSSHSRQNRKTVNLKNFFTEGTDPGYPKKRIKIRTMNRTTPISRAITKITDKTLMAKILKTTTILKSNILDMDIPTQTTTNMININTKRQPTKEQMGNFIV